MRRRAGFTPWDSRPHVDERRHPTGFIGRMYVYVYVLQSLKDGRWYTGSTDNLSRRIEEHERGEVSSTAHRRPLKLIYFEGCLSERDARLREQYLKTAWGKRYLRNRLKSVVSGSTVAKKLEGRR